MAKKKLYAVRQGRINGIFYTWSECQKQITGYSNAEYKSFTNLAEAEAYLTEAIKERSEPSEPDNSLEIANNETEENDRLIAYVDGSFREGIDKYSYGLLFLYPNGERRTHSGYDDIEEALISRNVAGELLGTMVAIEKCYSEGFTKLTINHDYEGISKWFHGEWKAKSFVAKKYVKFLSKYRDVMDIKFNWVKGHSNNEYNDLVDNLAKKALDKEQLTKQGETYLVVDIFDQGDIESIIEILEETVYVDDTDFHCYPNSDPKSTTAKKAWLLKHKKERLAVTLYKTGRLVVQGKKENLFLTLQTYILELTDSETIHKAYRETYNINVDKKLVEDEFAAYLPNKNSTISFSEKLNSSLKQAILNLHIEGEMFEFTHLAFPALRSLEGFLKEILKKHNVNPGGGFHMFEPKDNGTYKLKSYYESSFGSNKKIMYINKLYNYFYSNRHRLFHWDDYEGYDTTSMLTENAWKNTITDVFQLINEYYIVS